VPRFLPILFTALISIAVPAAPVLTPALAQEHSPPATGVLSLLPATDSVTEHVLDLGARKLAYTATAGTLALFNQNGERSASVFYTAYVAKDAGANRPLTFAFNGGPGAGSAFLHLGLAGPKILDFGGSGHDGAKAKLIDNPHSLLASTDLVFIDPVGTGWSRPAKPDDTSFYGVRPDAQSIAKAIALYVAKNSRSESPKYLMGESYGGFRAVRIAESLKQDQGIIASGIVMISPFLDGALTFGMSRFALGAALQLPSLAATELERRKAFSREAMAEIEKFAMTDYLSALAGPPLKGDAVEKFNARVAAMTGLPDETVARTRGFVMDAYKRRARETAGVLSSYDIEFAAPDVFPESDSSRIDDPVLDGYVRAYGGAFASYARDQLGFKTDITYMLLNSEVSGKWDWGRNTPRLQASASDELRELLALIPSFRVLIAHGYSDIVTPYGASKYIVDHLPPSVADRVMLTVHRGGHMFYANAGSRAEIASEAAAFYAAPPPK
jgi:carboxypeptidase C (cathepsin A)